MRLFLSARGVARLSAAALFVCVAAPSTLTLTISAAVAQEASLVSGVLLPKGSKRFNDADKGFTGVLTDLVQQKAVGRTSKGSAETYLWSGDAYQEGRVNFTKSAVRRALVDAGYEVRAIDSNDLGGVNLFNHFDGDDAPFAPALTKREEYFVADHAGKKQIMVGIWAESNEALALSLMPVAFVAKASPQVLPNVPLGAVLVADSNDATKNLPQPKVPTFSKLSPKPRTVRGQVKDGAGKPIAGAQIAVHSSAGGGFRTTHKGHSNARGYLRSAGSCRCRRSRRS